MIKQRHGDLVHIPAGYMHQVENLQDCTKIAWDMYHAANLQRYALAWRYIHSQLKGAADYMAVAVLIRNAIVTGLKI